MKKPYLLFTLCNEHFGICVEHVLRVITLEKLIKVPNAPPFILGAISQEGNVIPVVDLAIKIELGKTDVQKQTKVIVLELEYDEKALLIGVLIDQVSDVYTIEASKLIPPTLEKLGFNTHVMDGIYKREEEYYTILNVLKIFEQELGSII
jgi:purine-binding chemotaxis protein CheW